jgi:hypothetical protein
LGEVGHGLLGLGLGVAFEAAQLDDDLGRALGESQRLALGIGDVAFGALADRVKGHELGHLVGVQRLRVLHEVAHRLVDGVLTALFGGQGAGQDDLIGALRLEQDRIAEGEDVLGQGAGLVRAQDIDPCQLLDGLESGDDGLLPRQRLGAHGVGDRHHRRHGHRDGGDQQYQHHACDVRQLGPLPGVFHHDILIELESHQDDAQDHRDRDEKVADFGGGLLGVRGPAAGAGHQAGGTAEEGVVAGTDHHRAHLALLGDTAGVALVTDLFTHRQGLAGERGLVDADVLPIDEAHIGGHHLAQLDPQHVSGDHLGGVDGGECPIAQCRGLGGQTRLQCSQGIGRLALLPEARDGVIDQQHHDDAEIRPMPHQQRQYGGGLDHPGDRPPEKGQEFLQVTGFLVDQLVAAVLLDPGLRLGRGQSLGGGLECLIDGIEIRLLQVFCGPRACARWLIVSFHVSTPISVR